MRSKNQVISLQSHKKSDLSPSSRPPLEPLISFHRTELSLILSCYGARVAQGEWRDYAIDMGRESAVFSIFRHTSDQPLYRLEKHPKLAQKQGAYLVRNDKGRVLKRGRDLSQVLKVFERKIALVDCF